jgi:hypothetical protein
VSKNPDGSDVTLEQLLRYHHIAFKPAEQLLLEKEAQLNQLTPAGRPETDEVIVEASSGFRPIGQATGGLDLEKEPPMYS